MENSVITKIRQLKNYFIPKGSFKSNVATMMTGTGIAQAIPVIIAPILTRLYTAEDFGLCLLYVSFTVILSTLVTGRYDQAVFLPKEDEHALRLVVVSLVIITCVSGGALVFFLMFAPLVAKLTGNQQISFWLYFVPISSFCTGLSDVFSAWFMRKKMFSISAKRRIVQSIIMVGLQLLFGVFAVRSGLVIGWIVGDIAVALFFSLAMFSREGIRLWSLWKSTKINETMASYRRFPLYDIPTVFTHTLTNQMPIMLLSSFFGSAAAGLYGFTQRILNIPITFFAQTVADVFKQRISEEYVNVGSCRALFVRTVKGLSFIVVPFTIGLLLLAPSIFSFVFGKEWEIAGRFAQFLSVYYGLRFFSSATSYMFIVIKKQRYNLVIQGAMLFSIFVSIYVGYTRHDVFIAILMLGICGVFVYSASFCLLYWCSGLVLPEK